MHKLLMRQLKKYLSMDYIPENFREFIKSINSAYYEFEEDKGLMERSIEISSREYNERTAQLEKAEKYLANLLETIPQGIINIDPEGKIVFANSAAEKIFGFPKEKLVGRPFNDPLWQMRTAKGYMDLTEAVPLKRVLVTGQPISGNEYIITNVDGVEHIINLYATPLYEPQGEITGVVVSLEDITLRKEMEKQIEYISVHDSLTGLYNRAYFEEEMYRMSNGRYNPVGIVIIDIDGLKLVNDTFGHEQGDKLLYTTAIMIKESFGEKNIIARIGGDEFAILLPCSKEDHIENVCQKLKNKVKQYNFLEPPGNKKIPLSVSIGFAVSEETNVFNLYKEADNNMYQEKVHHHQDARSNFVETLIKALEARDFNTENHASRMCQLIIKFAKVVDLSQENESDLILFAKFHDIGKVGIPDRILFKTGPLTPEEFTEMKRHCEIGHRIAQSSPDLVVVADLILKHHEWWNGGGYPLGLKKDEIPLECRMLAIVDAYDAMTSDRPYRKALKHEEAAAELLRCAGTQFDPEQVGKFLQIPDLRHRLM